MKATQRYFGLDLVRIAAITFVIVSHFFAPWNTDYRESGLTDLSTFLQSMGQLVLQGVALFMIITGYLCGNKTPSKKYYKGCFRVLLAYLFYSIITIAFRIHYLGQNQSVFFWINSIFDFSGIPYAWYIEMWIGLFLLIPFLNILYHNIADKKLKLWLIVILSAISFLPNFTNRYGLHPLPDFWGSIYPLAYYFIGMYIKEYQPKINKWLGVGLLVTLGCLNGLINLIFSHGSKTIYPLGDITGIVLAAIGVVWFLLLYDIKCENRIVTSICYKVSVLSLDMYLCAYMFDALVYPWFKDRYFVNQSQFGVYFFIIIPVLLIGTFTLSWVKETIFAIPGRIKTARKNRGETAQVCR